MSFNTAKEILKYAIEELEKALKLNDVSLYRNAADKAFLALVVAVNTYIQRKLGVVPQSHSERRRLLREMGKEYLRELYSDLMKTLHEEAFYEGIYQPEEVKYAIKRIEELIKEFEREVSK